MMTSCLLMFSAVMMGQLAPKTEVPTALELIEKIPAIDSWDGKCRNIELTGRLREQGEMDLKFRAVYSDPTRCSLLVCDGSDDTPLLFVVGRRMLIYDPVGPFVFCSNSTRFDFLIQSKGKTSSIAFGISSDKRPGRILFDIKGLLSFPAMSEDVVHTGGTNYRVTRTTTDGVRVIAYFDLSKPYPVTKLEGFSEGEKEPNMIISPMIFDGKIKDEDVSFPDEKSLAKVITVKELPADNLLATLGGMISCVRACYIRTATHQPPLRDNLKFPGLLCIDWDKVKQNDAKYSEALKKLIPIVTTKS